MRGFVLSAIYAGAILVVIGAELFPATGIFLMFLVGPIWAAVIFNIWMVHLGVEAWTGRIARPWLAVPVFFYLAYEATVIGIYFDARGVRDAIEQANALSAAPPPHIAVVIDARPNEIGANSAAPYAAVADGFDVYYGDYLLKRFERGDPSCKAPFWDSRKIQPRFRVFGPMGRRECFIAVAAKAPRPAIHIVRVPDSPAALEDSRRQGRSFAPAAILHRTDITLFSADGSRATLGHVQAGMIRYPVLLPLVIAGCALNSGAPSWDCTFGPAQETMPVGGGEGYSDYDLSHAAYVLRLLHLPVRD